MCVFTSDKELFFKIAPVQFLVAAAVIPSSVFPMFASKAELSLLHFSPSALGALDPDVTRRGSDVVVPRYLFVLIKLQLRRFALPFFLILSAGIFPSSKNAADDRFFV